MTKLKLLGATAILALGLATPAMSQEATQEPGMIGFAYPNSNYMRGGYGVRTPSRHDYSYYHEGYYEPRAYYGPRGYYGPRAYYGPGPVGLAAGVAAGAVGTAAAIAGAPYEDSYAYYRGPGYW